MVTKSSLLKCWKLSLLKSMIMIGQFAEVLMPQIQLRFPHRFARTKEHLIETAFCEEQPEKPYLRFLIQLLKFDSDCNTSAA